MRSSTGQSLSGAGTSQLWKSPTSWSAMCASSSARSGDSSPDVLDDQALGTTWVMVGALLEQASSRADSSLYNRSQAVREERQPFPGQVCWQTPFIQGGVPA